MKFKNFDEEYFDERVEYSFGRKNRMIEVAQTKGNKLFYLFKNSVEWITLKIMKGETDREELRGYFQLAMQGIYGHLKLVDKKGETIKLVIAGKEVELENNESGYDNVFTLMEAFTYAAICRSKEVLDFIFSIKEESPLLRQGEHFYHPIYKLYYLLKNEPGVTRDQFDDYVLASEKYYGSQTPEGATDEYENYQPLIEIPRRKLWREYFLGTEQTFNEYLNDALQKNKEYYDTENHNRLRDVSGWLPWNLISVASKAYDKGWEITVEDPRLPMFLVKGECKVESLAP